MEFTIDFFELAFLAEVCIPPVPIARHKFWIDLIDKHYQNMEDKDRKHLFEWITENRNFDKSNNDCQWFYARYNPKNQYSIETTSNGTIVCFKKDEDYWVSTKKSIKTDFIKSVEKIE